jgi:hypothetical protein
VEKNYLAWQLSDPDDDGMVRGLELRVRCRTWPLFIGLGPESAAFFERSITPPSHPFFVAFCGISVSLVARLVIH